MKSLLRSLIDMQRRVSWGFDRILPGWYRVDGNTHFEREFAPGYLRSGMTVYDVGGGKHPFIDAERVQALGLRVVGVDIDQTELDRAPDGAYAEAICTDITRYRGRHDADLVVCRALLEHVSNVEEAFEAIGSILKPGGQALIFVPSRNAVFARLNLLLPERLKRKLLYSISPGTEEAQGFKSYYHRCTPRDFRAIARRNGLSIENERHYYRSSYFSFFFPAYLTWRIWILGYRLVARDQAAETFSMAFRRAA